MKKFYMFLSGILLSSLAFAQVPPWASLPNDFLSNPYNRMTIKVRQVEDAYVEDEASLEAIWNKIEGDYKIPIDAWVNSVVNDVQPDWTTIPIDITPQTATEFAGEFAMMASGNFLALVTKITDDEVDFASGDALELVMAPYADAYDPERTVYGDTSSTHYNEETGRWDLPGNSVTEDTLMKMSYFGLWGETGAAKYYLSPGNFDSGNPYYASKNMVFADITNFGDTLDMAGGAATSTVPFITMVEPFSDGTGFYYLCAMPWQIFTNGFVMDEAGEAMSLALQYQDVDSDNITYNDWGGEVTYHYTYWGGTDNNSAYWATAFYGARAELVSHVGFNEMDVESFGAYYAGNRLHLDEPATTLEVYSVTGARVKSMNRVSGSVDLSDLQNGLYIATLKSEKGVRGTIKFIKY